MRTLAAAAIFVMASILFDSCVFGTNDCLFGDIGTITLKGSPKPMTCSEFLTPERKTKCYRDDIGQYCCESCKKLENAKTPDCLYGDKITLTPKGSTAKLSCSALIAKQGRGNCNRKAIEDGCCETCPKHRDMSKPGCMYGDKITITPKGTTTSLTCTQFIAKEGKIHCYSTSTKDGCCETCEKNKNPSKPACEFGDKSKDCIKYPRDRICPSPQYAAICCDYCSGWLGKRSANLENLDSGVQITALFGNLAHIDEVTQFGDLDLIEEA